ncbi:MAG: PqqD family protein [Ruminococcus sp.]|jgi:hypothetical protein|nr:PqqD family protein [Ruminococcus sp.]
MKLNSNFITHDDGDEKMIVSTGAAKFSGLVRGNKTAGFIIDCLENDTTEAEILEKMKQHFEGPEDLMANDIKKIIAQLKEIGAIDD